MRALGNNRWLWGLMGIGVFLRVYPYLYNRSLWFDEAMLANNIVEQSFSQLLEPLEYGQIAPLGFLYLEKCAYLLLGHSAYSLRLFPLLAGLLSLFLFYQLALHFFNPLMARLALAFLVFCDPHIYYSIEVKQYIFDVLAALTVGLWIPVLSASKQNAQVYWRHGAYGAVLIFFSQPVIFCLAALPLVGLLREKTVRLHWIYFTLPWLLVFGGYYFGVLRPMMQDSGLQTYHQIYFMPLDFWTVEAWQWYINSYFSWFRSPGGIFFKYMAGTLALIALLKGFKGRRMALLSLLFPFLLAVGASAIGLYSTIPRLLLFALPILLILVTEGIGLVYLWVGERWAFIKHKRMGFYLMAGLLFLQPTLDAIHQTAEPREIEDIQQALSYIQEHWQSGDLLYLYHYAEHAYQFYQTHYPLDDLKLVHGRTPWEEWPKDFEALGDQKRVWLLFSHDDRDQALDRNRYTDYLDLHFQQLRALETKGTACYLYDFESSPIKQIAR